jgi:hypothetical protein
LQEEEIAMLSGDGPDDEEADGNQVVHPRNDEAEALTTTGDGVLYNDIIKYC